jgi:CPA1 family monovalent cation:H+ antiporter
MRGTVTLAAALALPAGFPYRGLVLFTAFSVVLGTLVLQGVTLRPLMRLLGLERDDAVEREVRLAREETTRAAAGAMDSRGGSSEIARLLQKIYQSRLEGEPGPDGNGAVGELLRSAVAAQRRRLVELRDQGTIGDDAFHRVEEDLDWAELNAEAIRRRE